MTRDYLTAYLTTVDCYPAGHVVPGVGEEWKNGINGNICYIPFEDELELTTYCHVFYELKVDPPLQYGYDSDYAVYVSFRETQLPKWIEEAKKKEEDKKKGGEAQAD